MELYILTFLLVHIFLGRKISVPYGLAIGLKIWWVALFALALDVVQIPFFYYIYEGGSKAEIVKRLKGRLLRREEDFKSSKLFKFAKKWGKVGAILVVALPFQGGGIWSGVMVAYLLGFSKREGYLLLTLGSITGIFILIVGFAPIIEYLKRIW